MKHNWQDRWKIIEETPLRRGGHSVVRHVVAVDDGREGALKVLNDDAGTRRERRFRMREDVNALRVLSAGVPKLFDENVTEADETVPLFFVMEWIPGPSLAQYLNRGVMSLDDALACTYALLDTLEAMHALPLVHRDLKPDSIILRDGAPTAPVIVDLGLAWAEARIDDSFETEHGQEMGNRFLRLPEFAPGRANQDPRSDVTLVAGLLLFMLSGSSPRVLTDEHGRAPNEALADSIPEAIQADRRWPKLSRVFCVSFQTEVRARYQSIADLRQALSRLEPASPPEDLLSPALERLRATIESAQWQRQRDREASVAKLGAKFDNQLRTLLGATGLSLPGGHGFLDGRRIYRDGICLALEGGGIVCALQHIIEIGDSELVAAYGVERSQKRIVYYRGPLTEFDSLEAAMWDNAERMIAFILDEFNRVMA